MRKVSDVLTDIRARLSTMKTIYSFFEMWCNYDVSKKEINDVVYASIEINFGGYII